MFVGSESYSISNFKRIRCRFIVHGSPKFDQNRFHSAHVSAAKDGALPSIFYHFGRATQVGLPTLHHLRDRNEFVAFRFVFRDQVIGGYDCLRAVGAHLLVAAVVEEDDVSAADLF